MYIAYTYMYTNVRVYVTNRRFYKNWQPGFDCKILEKDLYSAEKQRTPNSDSSVMASISSKFCTIRLLESIQGIDEAEPRIFDSRVVR